jgi:hypothetical protein
MKHYGPERAEECGEDDKYFLAISEREPQPSIEEQRFSATLRNLVRSRHLIASTIDELAKSNEHLKSLRVAAWLIVWLLVVLVLARFWH